MSTPLELAKMAIKTIAGNADRRTQRRLEAADELRAMAQLTESLRIALHSLNSSEPARLALRAAEYREVRRIWETAWAHTRPELDRYIEGGIVAFLREVRHEGRAALVTIDALLHELEEADAHLARRGFADGLRKLSGGYSGQRTPRWLSSTG